MSSQPTGDYRLIPWAYPPIPGGSSTPGGSNPPFDLTDVRIENVIMQRINSTSTTYPHYRLSIGFNVRGIKVLDASGVGDIYLHAVPLTAIFDNSNIAMQYDSGDASMTLQQIESGNSFQISAKCNKDANTGTAGTTSIYTGGSSKVTFVVKNKAGNVVQSVDLGVIVLGE